MKRMVLLSALLLIATGARGQWVPTNGPGNGPPVKALVVHNGKLIAGTGGNSNSNVFVSTDSGRFWQSATSTRDGYEVDILLSHNGYLFACTFGGYLWRSSDNGATWNLSNSNEFSDGVTALTLIGDTLFAATYGDDSFILPPFVGIYRSTDDGTTWNAILLDTSYLFVYSLIGSSNVILASTDSGVLRSSDRGASWAFANSGLPKGASGAITFIGSKCFVASVSGGIYRSTDSGLNWNSSNTGLPSMNVNGFLQHGSLLYLYGRGIYRSFDSGASWSAADSGFTPNVLSICFDETELIAGTDTSGTFLSTDNGTSWSKSITGMATSSIGGMGTFGTNLVGSSNTNFYQTADRGATWTATKPAANLGIIISYTGYPFIVNGLFVPSASDSLTVVLDTNFPYNVDRPTDGGGANAILQFGDTIMTSAGYGIYRSTNMGQTWTDASQGLPFEVMGPLMKAGSDILVGISGSVFFSGQGSGVYRSSDYGNSWFPSNFGIDTSNIQCLAEGTEHFFAGTLEALDDGENFTFIYSSSNNGRSWSVLNVGLAGVTGVGSEVLSIGSGRLFINSNLGLLYSSDDGLNWMSANSDLPNASVTSVMMHGEDLFAAVSGNGVWRRPLSDFGISSVAPQSAQNNSLIAYPNPFSHTTMLAFTSAQSGYATVTLVNPLGEVVARVFEGELSEGNHSFPITVPAALPAGMYECVVRMNGQLSQVGLIVQ